MGADLWTAITGCSYRDGTVTLGWTITHGLTGRSVGGDSTGDPRDGAEHHATTNYPGRDSDSLTRALPWLLGTDDSDALTDGVRAVDDAVLAALGTVDERIGDAVAEIAWASPTGRLPAHAAAAGTSSAGLRLVQPA